MRQALLYIKRARRRRGGEGGLLQYYDSFFERASATAQLESVQRRGIAGVCGSQREFVCAFSGRRGPTWGLPRDGGSPKFRTRERERDEREREIEMSERERDPRLEIGDWRFLDWRLERGFPFGLEKSGGFLSLRRGVVCSRGSAGLFSSNGARVGWRSDRDRESGAARARTRRTRS